ncbi:unnamed protein product [Staurois parvus]|uniref:Uncharacterized protein n=1 Tax=Staurois parvus TaxID=386267 RepID=A0ABN9GG04_9NEOB|nr:unnamed protein product [Staurois parvus]
MYTDHQGTNDQCALMISVAPAVPPVSVHLSSLSVPPIRAASQCQLSVRISVAYQCASVSPISAA